MKFSVFVVCGSYLWWYHNIEKGKKYSLNKECNDPDWKSWFPFHPCTFVPSSVVFAIFAISLSYTLGKGRGPSLEEIWSSFILQATMFWANLVEISLGRRWLYFDFVFSKLFLFGKEFWSFIWTNYNTLTQECFVPSLVEFGLVILKKILKYFQCIYYNV